VVLSSPPVLYTLVASLKDPFFKAWTSQNLILSPHPVHYLLAYGPILAAILAGWPQLRMLLHVPGADELTDKVQPAVALPVEMPNESHIHPAVEPPDNAAATQVRGMRILLPAAWASILPFLVYAPYPLQRRLAEGAWVALTALGLAGLEGRRVRLAPLFFSLLLPSTALLLAGGLAGAVRPSLPVFRPAAETAAFEFIASSAKPGAVILAAYNTANALPAWAPVRVIAGHGPESPALSQLLPRLARFYDPGTPDAERQAMLVEFGVQLVFWGPAERSLGEWDPHTAPYLRPIYEEGGYTVFVVIVQGSTDNQVGGDADKRGKTLIF
jgi:hypothetical protein